MSKLLPAHSASSQVASSQAAKRDKASLRRHFRRLRRGLSPQQQKHNAIALQHQLLRTLLLLRYNVFAIYSASDGEISTAPIAAKLWEYSKTTALPVLTHSNFSTPASDLQMHFSRYSSQTLLVRGAYNLNEPALDTHLTPELIFLPLVAFDRSGTRLGMGGGFYDRYTAHPSHKNTLRIGLAHRVQVAEVSLPKDGWDQPLDAVITESETLAFNDRAATLLGFTHRK